MRTFYGKPLRDFVEKEAYPDKMSIDDFYDHIYTSIIGFSKQVRNHPAGEDKFIEEWYETFAAWNDIKTED